MAENGTAAASPRRPRADARRSIDLILSATDRLIGTDGPLVPLDEVAREAGVSPATLYRHFPSRMHLLEQVYRDRATRFAERAQAVLTMTGAPLDALTQWLEDFVMLGIEAQGVLGLLIAQGLRESDPAENARWGYAQAVATASELLASAQEAGHVRADVEAEDLVLLATGIVAAVESRPGIDTPERCVRARRTLKIVIAGIVLPES